MRRHIKLQGSTFCRIKESLRLRFGVFFGQGRCEKCTFLCFHPVCMFVANICGFHHISTMKSGIHLYPPLGITLLYYFVKVTWSLLYYTKKDNIFSSITYSLGALQKVWVLQKCIQIERRAWYLACRTLQSTLFSERVDIHDFQHQLTRK